MLNSGKLLLLLFKIQHINKPQTHIFLNKKKSCMFDLLDNNVDPIEDRSKSKKKPKYTRRFSSSRTIAILFVKEITQRLKLDPLDLTIMYESRKRHI